MKNRRSQSCVVLALLSFFGVVYLSCNYTIKITEILEVSKERPAINQKSRMLHHPEEDLTEMVRNSSINQRKFRNLSEIGISSAESVIQTHAGPRRILFYNPLTYQLSRGILKKSKDFFKHCEISSCIMEFDQTLANRSDAVIFNSIRNLDLDDKRPGQIWIMFQWESLQHHITSSRPAAPMYLRNKVNWTISYTKSADFYLPYGKVRHLPIEMRPKRNYTQIAKSKTKDALWIVSLCKTMSEREKYVRVLQQYISIDILGRCGKEWDCGEKRVHDQCFDILNETYRYYLAFENSLCKDYISEKFFENYKYDIVLVVRAGDMYNRPVNMSKQAYISTNEFRDAQELGKYLRKLSDDPEAYASILRAKDEYEIVPYMDIMRDASCEICKRLHSVDKNVSVYNFPLRWMQETQQCYEPYDL